MHFSIPETQEFTNGSSVFTVSLMWIAKPSVLHNQSRRTRTHTRMSCETNPSWTLHWDLFIQSSVGIGCEKFFSCCADKEHEQCDWGSKWKTPTNESTLVRRDIEWHNRHSFKVLHNRTKNECLHSFALSFEGLFALQINTSAMCRNQNTRSLFFHFSIYFRVFRERTPLRLANRFRRMNSTQIMTRFSFNGKQSLGRRHDNEELSVPWEDTQCDDVSCEERFFDSWLQWLSLQTRKSLSWHSLPLHPSEIRHDFIIARHQREMLDVKELVAPTNN